MPSIRKQSFLCPNRDVKDSDGSQEEDGRGVGDGCCSDKICWCEPPLECLPLEFCNNTSLHGLQYLGQSKRHLTERLFWFMAFLAGCSAAVYFISDIWKRYNESPVIVSFEPIETNIDSIPFPAVTICNMNKVRKCNADSYIEEAESMMGKNDTPNVTEGQRNLYYLNYVCISTQSFTKKYLNYLPVPESLANKTEELDLIGGAIDRQLKETEKNRSKDEPGTKSYVKAFLREASQNCTQMLLKCTWRQKVYNCSELFRPIETDFGKCCSFNIVPQSLLHRSKFEVEEDEDENEVNLWRQAKEIESGGTWGNMDDNDTAAPYEKLRPRRQSQSGKSFGLTVLLDPDIQEYFCTTSDSEGFRLSSHLSYEIPHVMDNGIAIPPDSEVFVGVIPEVTKADPSTHGYPLSTRNCYFPFEYNLTHYEYYTVANCIDECIADATLKECSCVQYYMPNGISGNETTKLCGPNSFDCVEEVKTKLGGAELKRLCGHCYPSCEEILYFEKVTTTPLKTDVWEGNGDGECDWKDKKLSILHLYFGSDSTYARVRKELFGITDLVANTGGLMGLCLGFSVLSAVELIYFLTLRAWCRKRRRRTIGARVAAKFRDIWVKVKQNQKYGTGGMGAVTGLKNETQTNEDIMSTFVHHELNAGFKHRLFKRTDVMLPNTTKAGRTLKGRSGEEANQSPPNYNSVIHEIRPLYGQNYWNLTTSRN